MKVILHIHKANFKVRAFILRVFMKGVPFGQDCSSIPRAASLFEDSADILL